MKHISFSGILDGWVSWKWCDIIFLWVFHGLFLLTRWYFMFYCRRQEKTLMKLIVDAESDKVLGASMCGPDAAEIMQVLITSPSFCCVPSRVLLLHGKERKRITGYFCTKNNINFVLFTTGHRHCSQMWSYQSTIWQYGEFDQLLR